MECPKCGRVIQSGAFICPGCDYILDATFLGDDITDDERDHRPGRTAERSRAPKVPRVDQPDFGEDAMILGDVNQVGDVSEFNSRDAGVSQREVTQARFYIGGAVAQLMMADAIPEPGAGVAGVSIRMTPFERHVLGFVNGRRSVGRIQKKSAMEESEFKTALAMLADKGFIRLKGWKKQKPLKDGGPPAINALMSTSGTAERRPSSSLSSSRSSLPSPRSSSLPSPPANEPAAERTVVASMEHIEALARAAADVARATVASNAVNTAAPTTPTSPPRAQPPGSGSGSMAAMPQTRVVPSQSSLRATDDVVRPPGSDPDWPDASTAVGPLQSMATASRRFASLQAERPASSVPDSVATVARDEGLDVEALKRDLRNDQRRDDPGLDELDQIDPLAAAAAAVWDSSDNQSSVFSDGDEPAVLEAPSPSDALAPAADAVSDVDIDVDIDIDAPPARKPLVATRPTGHFAADDDDDELPSPVAELVGDPAGFDDHFDGFTSDGLAALRDPTGMGDGIVGDDEAPAAAYGEPIDDDDDDDFVVDEGDSAEGDAESDADAWNDAGGKALLSTAGASADDDIDDALLGPPRRVHDERTSGHNPFTPRADIFGKVTVGPSAPVPESIADGFDLAAPATGVQPRPLTLAPSALMPVEPEPPPPPPRESPRPSFEAPVPLELPLPAVVTVAPLPAPTPPMVAPTPHFAVTLPPALAAAVLSLPGQNLVTSSPASALPAGVPSKPVKPAAPTRVSAASSVPFELRKKAERIYEQAIKDQAEGRMSSALMNAKLAMNFDNSVDTYRALFDELSKQKAAPAGPRPRELVLFEQASEAEGKGDYLRAVKLLEDAIAVNPRAAALYNRIGVVLSIRLKRHNEALAHLKKAIDLEPGSIVYMNNFSKVAGLLESMLDKDPKKNKGKVDDDGGKVVIGKVRPKLF